MRKAVIFMTLVLVALLVASCSKEVQEPTQYQGNYPEGTFKLVINDEVMFTNGPDIIEVIRKQGPVGCFKLDEDYECMMVLSFTISDEVAARQKIAMDNLEIVKEGGFEFLSSEAKMYLFDQEIESLKISKDLKGKEIKDFSTSTFARGKTKKEALANATQSTQELYDVLRDQE